VHGANRLASNSLLEGVVFGARTGKAAARYARVAGAINAMSRARAAGAASPGVPRLTEIRADVRRLMWEGVGLVRSADSLARTIEGLRRFDWLRESAWSDREALEAQNLHLVATLIAEAALRRRGSLGSHFRSDHPTKGLGWRRHFSVGASDRTG
jgi:L-aspartate oxidase